MSAILHHQLQHLALIPHGHCYLWQPELIGLHAISDGLIAIAYFLIPISILYFTRQHRHLPYPWLFQLFGAFIIACGLTHVIEIWTLWYPTYWISGGLKLVTAAISLTAVAALIPVIPQALNLDREATKAALAESQQRYRDLVENSPDIIERFDLQLRHLYVSPVLTKITGIATDIFMGKTCREMSMDEDMVNAWETAAARLIATGKKQIIEFSTQTLMGERFFEMAIAPELSEQQTIESILCISRDITERKHTETQLRDLSDRLKLAIQSARMGIWDWDVASNCLTWDERIYELYGLPQSVPASYQAWESVMHPDDFPRCNAATQQAFNEKNEGAIEFRVIKPDGTWRYLESYFLVQRDASDRPLRLIGVNLDVSDRKQAELQLRELSTRLELAVQTAKMGIWDWDIVNDHQTWNDRTYEIYGLSPGTNITYTTWQSVIHPDDVAYCHAASEKARAEHTEGVIEFRVVLPDGSLRYVESYFLVQRNSSGQPIRMLGVNLDISDRKQAEEARLQAEKLRLELSLLENILDTVLAGYWDTNSPIASNYWSPGLKRMLGYEDHELPNAPNTWKELMFAEDLPRVLACLERHVQSHGVEPYYNEVRYPHKNGSTVWVICAGQVINWDASGQPLRMVGCHVDITKLKQTEAQLQQSAAHLRQAQRIGKIGSWEFDLKTEKIAWSEQVFHLFGLDPAEGTPKSFDEFQQLLHPDDRAFHQQTVETAIATAQPYDVEYRFYRTDGTLSYMQSRGEAILDPAGRTIGITGTALDITERKQAEAKILQTTAQLEASNRELEAFAYSVSHDLRAPLRAIDGFSKALLEDYSDQFDEEGQYYFDRIRHNVQRMGMLIDDLLSLSRVSRYEMQFKTVNLSALVKEQADELQTSDPERQVEFVITPDAIVAADPTLMRVVVNNLLANAWKFTSHHSSARIEFGIIKQGKQTVYFVRDDGAGFDMAYASKLFGVFQRLHNTNEFPGTGIGLATVQRAVHRHGGHVWAEGKVEQGATIYFTIPDAPFPARA